MTLFHKICRVILICVAVLALALPAGALDLSEQAERIPDAAERYQTQYMEETNGSLFVSTGYIAFSAKEYGAAFTLYPEVDAQGAECNAYRFVFVNRAACDTLSVSYRYRDTAEWHTTSMSVSVGAEQQTSFCYMNHAERVEELTVSLPNVKSGSLRLYSINAVSVYRPVSEQYGTVNECVCRPEDNTLTLSGRVYSRVSAQYRSAELLLYRLRVGQGVFDLLSDSSREALGRMDMETRFSFTVDAAELADRLAEYAVTIRLADGTEFPLTAPTGVTRYGEYTVTEGYETKYAYKGVETACVASAISAGSGTVIIDVDLYELFGTPAGSPYSFGGMTLFIERSVLTGLDSRIRACHAAGVQVILRAVISTDAVDFSVTPKGETSASFRGILLETEEARDTWYVMMQFLVSRYGMGDALGVDGIAIGFGTDDAEAYADCGGISMERAIASFTAAVRLLQLAALREGTDMQVFLPISDAEAPELISATEIHTSYHSGLYLGGLLASLEAAGCRVKVLLDAVHMPVTLSEEGILVSTSCRSAADVETWEAYLADCGYSDSYLVCLTPGADWTLSETVTAYLYTFRAFENKSRAESVLLCVGETADSAVFSVIRSVDTGSMSGMESAVLQSFGAVAWGEILTGYRKTEFTHVYETVAGVTPTDARGTYALWDFSMATGTLGWNADPGVSGFSIQSDVAGHRRLRMDVSFAEDGEAGFFYLFSTPESFDVCDAFGLRLSVGNEGELYEVAMTFISERGQTVCRSVVGGGSATECSISTVGFSEPVTAIRVSVRCLSGQAENTVLYVDSISVCSRTLDSAELKSAVLRAREQTRAEETDTVTDTRTEYLLPIFIVIAALGTASPILMQIRHRKLEQRKE